MSSNNDVDNKYATISGLINFKFKDYDAAVRDFSACLALDKNDKSALTYLVS